MSGKSDKSWIIESKEGQVLRASPVGLVLSGSDPHIYTNEQLAKRVAEDFAGMMGTHGIKIDLMVRDHANYSKGH